MNFLTQVSIVILTIQCCEIVCRPHHQFKHGIQKSFHFEIIPVPFKQFSFVLEKIIPFGKFELKHDIHKRQIVESEISPISNEIPVANVAIEEINKTPPIEILDKKEEKLVPEVIITTIIKPVEEAKVEESEVVITPEKEGDIIKQSSEVLITEEIIPKPVEVVPQPGPVIEITPKPLEVPPPVEQPVVQNVVVSTPIESTVPPLSNVNFISPVLNKIPVIPILHTDISKIPLSGISYPIPSPVPVPEVIISPPPPPPPPVKEPPVKEPPVVKEETPNIFVKGSRFVLYFGSMMLQMLSQLVNGRINLNQPLPAVLPELQ
ncbi:repetitive proline-rich cell wall protein 2-like [Vanessa cardui]|uniref:repetitive proline-rich cell wall protein 2-like n=1 Tax=Vanessa cardui TaxID=171605 RepID=UPI001F13F2F6|nr:repetitive proline-rich cell wall protein 2-like [Vanessa cardui]